MEPSKPKPKPRPPIRPKVYPDRDGKGAPAMTLRLPPDLMDWVRSRGGQQYVKALLLEMKRRCEEGWGAYAGPRRTGG